MRSSPLARLGFLLGVLAVVALFLAGLGARWGWWNFGMGFRILKWAAYGGVVAAIVSLIGAFTARPGSGRTGLGLALAGVILGIAAFGVPYSWRRTASNVPPIHDISTDTDNPPAFQALLAARAHAVNPATYGGPEVARQQHEAYPDIKPLMLSVSPGEAFARARKTAEDMGWTIAAADSAAGRIEATDRTRWFGFYDDVVIRISPAAQGSRVDVRSVSRVGRSDVGTNARRVRNFLDRMK